MIQGAAGLSLSDRGGSTSVCAALVWCQLSCGFVMTLYTALCMHHADILVSITDSLANTRQLLFQVHGIILEPNARPDCNLSKWGMTSDWITLSRLQAYDMCFSCLDAHQREEDKVFFLGDESKTWKNRHCDVWLKTEKSCSKRYEDEALLLSKG